MDNHLEVIVLAAGQGTRMKSPIPKVIHQVVGEPMVCVMMEQIDSSAREALKIKIRFNVVVGHGKDAVEAEIKKAAQNSRIQSPVIFTHQKEQLGTAHAVRLALGNASKSAKIFAVFNGDLPLFTKEDFIYFWKEHVSSKSLASLASASLEDAGQYGRVIRKGKNFVGTVEYKDATPAQKKIKEYNGGVYLFERKLLEEALNKTSNKNASGEFYLPDVFNFAFKKKKKILACHYQNEQALAGVNNLVELAAAENVLLKKIADHWMAEGVRMIRPETSVIGLRVTLSKGCVIGSGSTLLGKTKLAENVSVGPGCELIDMEVGSGTVIKSGSVLHQSKVGENCSIGPMAHLRPGNTISNKVKIGNFVELKESNIGAETSISHLSYLGDADVGKKVNIGCGFVTCNYDGVVRDGKRKHRSVIGDNVFIGSDSQVVAPIKIADGSFIASGSTVTESVPEKDSLVVARVRQTTKPGYAKKYRS